MIQNILKYQEIDGDLWKIESEIKQSSERKKAQGAKNFLLESDGNLNKIDRRAEELLMLISKAKKTYADNAAVINEYESTAKTLKSEDEATYLSKKIAQVLDTMKSVERELALMTKDIEEVGRAFNDFKAKYTAAKKEYSENREKYEQIKKSKTAQINEIKAKLDVLAKKISPAVMEKYKKKRGDRIFPVLVPVSDNMCGQCRMQISLSEMSQLKSEKIIECEHCQRLIYTD